MDIEREFDDENALSRDRDPVVPRGAVVAGEQRELEVVWRRRMRNTRPGGEEGPWSYFDREPPPLRGSEDGVIICEREPLTPLLPAQERIRALEARLEQGAVERRLKEPALARARELEAAVAEMGARLERVRGVVASAVKWQGKTPAPRWADGGVSLWDAVDALTPEDREWAEAEEKP